MNDEREQLSLHEKISLIQSELKVPKNQKNNFGNYNYRSCEDIMEGVKPFLSLHNLTIILTDEIVQIGDRYYIKAIATVGDGVSRQSTTGYARESETKKGMDESQITGSASSYARKYALNALLALDDNKDADTMNNNVKIEPNYNHTPPPSHYPKKETTTNKLSDKPSEKQVKFAQVLWSNLYELMSKEDPKKWNIKKKDYTRHAFLQSKFKKTSLNDLNRKEISSMIDLVNEQIEKRKNGDSLVKQANDVFNS